ncbi:hypothetical protein Tsubulata_016125 [Turnera subulata]|uniref:Cytochrome P450 n=1 Tax=Turnera subulata TaxID=218843 RepID=A0A9Q0GGB2_9ROSI|nr:hypothetical protein Tsubulata_016125 [Turnera subulata]
MEIWFLILVSLSICALLKSTLLLFFPSTTKPSLTLPPGPPTFPIIGSLLWLRLSFFNLEPILRSLHAKFGPIVTLRILSRPVIFVADRSVAHQALVQQGALCADRPPASATTKIFNSNQHNISASYYGPTWRRLRRNLTSEILHPSRVKAYSPARNWVLQILKTRLESPSSSGRPVAVIEDFQHAMFYLLVFMCFGDKLEEEEIARIEEVQRRLLLNFGKFNLLNFWPTLTKILLRKRWNMLYKFRKDQEDVLIPLIRARMKLKEEESRKMKEDSDNINEKEIKNIVCYVDTLLSLQLPDEKRKLDEGEMVSLCSEFLNAGTDTTSTALQWIMANLVKYPQIQDKLFREIKGVLVGGGDGTQDQVKEDDLQKMPYLKAVVLEGLRRHPPGHFVLPHAVTQEVVLDDKYVVPKDGIINFMVAEMGWDPRVWEDPKTFKPERFLNISYINGGEAFDITGNKEIKMMPFGAGRRICPAHGLAMLHLEYFVANLIWSYEWKPVDGVDLSEKEEFTVVMKNPLKAQVCKRLK